MILREFLTQIGFEADTKPIHHAEESLEHLKETIDHVKEKLEFLAAAEIVHKLYEISEHFAHWGEELKVMSENMGISTDELQRLNVAAERSGVASEEMTTGLARLSRQLYEAKTGSKEAANAFLKVGISSEQIKGFRNAKDALYALSDRMQAVKDPIARVGLAQELMGRGGFRMVAMLAKGSQAIREQGDEAEKLGLILSGPQVEALEEVEHTFQRFHGLLRSVAASMAAYIAPAFTFVIDKFIHFYNANKQVIGVNITEWLHGVGLMMAFMTGLVIGLAERLLALAKTFGMDGHILKMIISLSGAVTGLWTFLKVIGIAKSVLGTLATVLGPVKIAFNLLKIAALESVAPMITAAASMVGIDLAAAPLLVTFLAVAATIGAVVVAVHDLYALFKGEPTWIRSFVDWVATMDPVEEGLNALSAIAKGLYSSFLFYLSPLKAFAGWISDIASGLGAWLVNLDAVKKGLEFITPVMNKVSSLFSFGGGKKSEDGTSTGTTAVGPSKSQGEAGTPAGGGIMNSIKNFVGGGDTGAPALPDRMNALSSPEKALGGAANVTNNVTGGTQNYNMNVTMPVNVPAGTNVRDVGAKVKEGVKEHMEYLQRTIQRSTASPVSY